MASTTNPLLKYIVGGVLLILVIAVLNSGDDNQNVNEQENVVTTDLQEYDIQDGDTTKDTISTLVAHVKTLKKDTEELIQENKRLKSENRNTREVIKNEVDKVAQKQLEVQQNKIVQQNNSRDNYLDQLNHKLEMLQNKLHSQESEFSNQGDIPSGLGLDDSYENSTNGWIMPLDMPPMNQEGKYEFADINTGSVFEDLPDAKELIKEVKPIPVYTVPENATLLGSTAMTGMVGRIPIGGKITDPYPFKIIVGSDDLATNGHTIPGLSGMVFSGIATGDLMLSCISAKLYSVTYTFEDGTVRTIREESGAGVSFEDADGTTRRGLGWLSDEWGNPCIKGELITNAPAYLATIFALDTASGYAKAYAENEVTTTVSPDTGVTQSATTGDPYKKAGGEALGQGVDGVSDWVKARQRDSFDAIFVPSGTKVAVHVETALEIDYEPNGRKIAYENFDGQAGYTRELD